MSFFKITNDQKTMVINPDHLVLIVNNPPVRLYFAGGLQVNIEDEADVKRLYDLLSNDDFIEVNGRYVDSRNSVPIFINKKFISYIVAGNRSVIGGANAVAAIYFHGDLEALKLNLAEFNVVSKTLMEIPNGQDKDQAKRR